MTTDERKDAIEAAADLLIFAPLGFALEARTLLPRLVERGRNQVIMARAVGEFAVAQGQRRATRQFGPLQKQVESALVDLGLVPRAPTRDEARPPTPTRPAPDPTEDAVAPADDLSPPTPRPAVEDLAIPDYDSLAASQVVPRLRALSPAELEDVREYEAAGRARKTILNRVAQLQDS
jgi:hypothetical protein